MCGVCMCVHVCGMCLCVHACVCVYICVFVCVCVSCACACACVPYLGSGVVGNEVRCGLERYLVHWPVVVVGQVRRENTDPHLTLTLHEEVGGEGKSPC